MPRGSTYHVPPEIAEELGSLVLRDREVSGVLLYNRDANDRIDDAYNHEKFVSSYAVTGIGDEKSVSAREDQLDAAERIRSDGSNGWDFDVWHTHPLRTYLERGGIPDNPSTQDRINVDYHRDVTGDNLKSGVLVAPSGSGGFELIPYGNSDRIEDQQEVETEYWEDDFGRTWKAYEQDVDSLWREAGGEVIDPWEQTRELYTWSE